jgi:hypothetical protein
VAGDREPTCRSLAALAAQNEALCTLAYNLDLETLKAERLANVLYGPLSFRFVEGVVASNSTPLQRCRTASFISFN